MVFFGVIRIRFVIVTRVLVTQTTAGHHERPKDSEVLPLQACGHLSRRWRGSGDVSGAVRAGEMTHRNDTNRIFYFLQVPTDLPGKSAYHVATPFSCSWACAE